MSQNVVGVESASASRGDTSNYVVESFPFLPARKSMLGVVGAGGAEAHHVRTILVRLKEENSPPLVTSKRHSIAQGQGHELT
ncbi:hypothetical protein MBM_05195 [Drepanopeziza brunnea f. sp. 'multigermtubi' MB_m1]|uniref:Uncharacterized protein n=1 Tax=Marssonina brunnea f. sp. multigermtubi (strain MB_m1) TaxID=1072389 RepID=K1WUM0_MARBU|nr:uncharacterized protein MBM_05195 [Drepanopeziza brunnea f. sp. 'multigermtubi' MB_m1]EKD16726.1 hypothetical protein MBM_05195 [Drepanopeziza brunnea f. sp. 'multigermtubi' MB_m1]